MTMTIRRRADATPTRMEQTKPLGRYNDFDYLIDDGDQYAVGQARAESPDAFSVGPDARLFSEPRLFQENGNAHEVGRWFRLGYRVPSGEYQALVERDNAARTAKEKANRLLPVDYLDRFPLFDGRSDYIVAQAPTAISSTAFVVEGDPPADNDPIRRGYVPRYRPAARGREAIMERIAETGAKITVVRNDIVLVEALREPPLTVDIRDAIRAVEPIILREPCEYCDGEPHEAWTILEPGNGACEAVALGELTDSRLARWLGR